MLNELEKYVRDGIIEKLNQGICENEYGCDLAYSLFESENIDGTFTYNTYEAEEWIKIYFDEIGEVVEDIELNLGKESIPNPFTNAEQFQIVIILEVSQYLLSRCEYIEDNWNNEIELTGDVVELIIEQLNKL